jgi:hypothetical protein
VFLIETAEARITLPENVTFRQTAIYTGPQGSRGKDATVVEQRAGRIVFRTTRVLPPHNGLTVAAAWQKGVVEPPTSAQLSRYWLEDNRSCDCRDRCCAHAGYYAFAWLSVGAIRPSARSFRSSARPTECRLPRRALSIGCRSITAASPPPSSISG